MNTVQQTTRCLPLSLKQQRIKAKPLHLSYIRLALSQSTTQTTKNYARGHSVVAPVNSTENSAFVTYSHGSALALRSSTWRENVPAVTSTPTVSTRHSSTRPWVPRTITSVRLFSHTAVRLFDMGSSGTEGSTALIAFGSNLGDRVAHIENGLAALGRAGIEILKLSRLYETKPMYVEDQASFLNGAVLVRTDKSPLELLDTLQLIEKTEGRKRGIDKGPRTLDLDIVLYGQERLDHERLKIPHPLMMERLFVLLPLKDVLPQSAKFPPPPTTVNTPFAEWHTSETAIAAAQKLDQHAAAVGVTTRQQPLWSEEVRQPTRIMSILNITPDSFSDGGKLSNNDLDTVVTTAKAHIASGATILDVGGQSTRPNATLISAEEELSRVLPVLRAIRELSEIKDGRIAVSLDTFYASVAEACMEEDLVDIINDISAGNLDPNMLTAVAKYNKTIVLMHMRGTPSTMTKPEMTNYSDTGLLQGVAQELSARVQAAITAGIKPWRIILDPGIGFAKNVQQNLALLHAGVKPLVERDCDVLNHLPWLVGTSRKGFIGKITEVSDAKERNWGTAVCVSAAIQGGASIVRVHDVEEMAKVAKMADALYRGVGVDNGKIMSPEQIH